MRYSAEEIRQYAAEEDVKFIRMAFCDVEGRQKNIAIMPSELERAFRYGIAIDGSAIPGFGGEVHLTLERMGIRPESSHHEEGPGQNEIDFRYADPVTAADNAVTFRAVVEAVAAQNGLYADFTPKPLKDKAGSGMHINFSVTHVEKKDVMPAAIAGILTRIREMTVFLNPAEESYRRFGSCKAPGYVSWSAENRSQLIRVPAAEGEYRRAELRSPDSLCNPYLAFALLIRAAMEGIARDLQLPPAADLNLYTAPEEIRAGYRRLPESLTAAANAAAASGFIAASLPETVIRHFTRRTAE